MAERGKDKTEDVRTERTTRAVWREEMIPKMGAEMKRENNSGVKTAEEAGREM